MGVQFAGNILVQSNGGPLPIVSGGTGQTTAPTALNALLPSQSAQAGKVLTTNGTNVSWATSAATTPGGANTQLQFNDAGTFNGNANLTINKITGALTAGMPVTSTGYIVSDAEATTRSVVFQTAGSDRWLLQTTAAAESGGNAGSNFALVSVGDNGATTNVAFSVARNTQVVDFKSTPTINGVAIDTNPGTVTSVSVTSANGVSGSVATATSTPAITLTLGAITPSSVAATGTVTGSNLSGTNTGDQTNIAGNAATVTTNANLAGPVTSIGNTTAIANGAITNVMLANGAVANLSGTNTGDETTSTIKSKLSITTLSGSNTGDQTITLTSDVTGSGVGSFATTLATVNSAPQTDTFRKITVNGKGLTTATSAVSSGDITTALGFTPVNVAGGTMTGALILDADPTQALGAVTKQYADAISSGVDVHGACETASTAALPACTYANGASGVGATLTSNTNISINTAGVGGYTNLAVGARVLIKNQSATLQNGIYTVSAVGSATGTPTPFVLTRASDFDGSPTTEIQAGDLTYIQEGTLGGTQWVQTAVGTGLPGDYIVVGTNPLVFSQFSGAGTYTAGAGIDLTSNTISNTGVTSVVAGTNIAVSGATGAVTISVTGTVPTATTAGTATTLATARNINGVSFNGSADITVTAAAGTLTGATLAAGVTASSLTSVGTLGSLAVTGAVTGSSFNSITGLSSTTPAALGVAAVGTGTTAARADHVHVAQTTITGNAGTATSAATLTTARNINGVSFNGSADITVTAAAGTLTGATLNATVTASSLTSVGTLASLAVTGNTTSAAFVPNSATVPTNGMYLSAANTLAWATNSANRLTLSATGDLTATGNVTAYSDERLKTNWKDLPTDFVTKLATVKTGTYDRTDTDATQVGVSAQSLQTVLPEAVITQIGVMGTHTDMLSVAYGNAALAACVMLAREIEVLRAEIAALKA